jgi:hypothetical protein
VTLLPLLQLAQEQLTISLDHQQRAGAVGSWKPLDERWDEKTEDVISYIAIYIARL